MTWRSALLCSALFHALIIWVWAGWALPQRAVRIEPAVLVILQPAAKAALAPQPVANAAKPIAPRKLSQAAPVVMTQVQKSNALAALKPAEPAAVPVLNVATTTATANTAQMSAVEAESTSKTVVNSTPARTEAVTPPQYRAAYLQNPKPEMPYLSKVKGESGRVGLRVKVGIHGEPLLVRIEQSSGFSRLDNAAYQTVLEKWRFVPAKMGDTPIEGEVAFGIPFILTSE